MDILGGILSGFSSAVQPEHLLYAFIGVTIGNVIGILPGLGPTATIALLLPITFQLSMGSALVMLAGVYYGAYYGGSITSIMLNIPGETATVVTAIEGYPMAQRGEAGPALGMQAFASFIGGTLSVLGLMIIAPLMAEVALRFGPPEFAAIVFFGLTLVGYLAGTSMAKGFLIAAFGLLLGSVGVDDVDAVERFTFGSLYLWDGIDFVVVAMGVFGLGEIFHNLTKPPEQRGIMEAPKRLLPTREHWKRSAVPIGRGTFVGFILGMIPGSGPAVASIVSYAMEKRMAKRPEMFGKGAIEGIAGPEAANNAASSSGFIPLLTLGLPTIPLLALLLAAFMIHGVRPGPLMIQQHPDVFWLVVASMYVGNVMLLILNIPMIGVWIQLLKIPYRLLWPVIVLVILIGAFSLRYNPTDMVMVVIFGVVGYLMRVLDYPTAPFVLAMVLGPMLETSLRQTLQMGRGSLGIFLERPIALTVLIIAVILLITSFTSFGRNRKQLAVLDDE